VPPAKPQKAALKGLDGAYEGTAIEGMGRYEIRVELKTGWFGRAEATLKLLELQFHSLSITSVKLTPAKGPGRFDAVLSSDALPGAELKGEAVAGTIEVSTAAARGAIENVAINLESITDADFVVAAKKRAAAAEARLAGSPVAAS
jgi:hypothetical protein